MHDARELEGQKARGRRWVRQPTRQRAMAGGPPRLLPNGPARQLGQVGVIEW